MKHLRKSFLTLLALTLFGGAGAWAQGQLLTTINASSSFTNGTQTFDNIVTVTLDDVSYDANDGWYRSGSPSFVEVAPVNGVTVTGYMLYFSATDPIEFEGSSFTVALEGYRVLADDTQIGAVGITKIEVYGTANQAIELTKSGANQWSLGQAPDYDLELQVEYYEAHALKEIPAGWQVMVNGTDKTNAIVGDSLLITETDSVTLVPAGNPRRVKSVTLEEVVSLATPLTMEALTAGTIVVNMDEGSLTMKYSKNGGAKTTITATTTITVAAGDKVAFYGNGTSTTAYGNSPEVSLKGTAKTKVYGNIMSLVDETGYATARTLSGSYVFFGLFMNNTKLTDASGLLLPATTLAKACYSKMFYGCTTLTAAPELPATTLADFCYASMFSGCNALETAPALPATTLVKNSYAQMFYNCSKLSSVTCLATSISAGNCLYQWLQGAGSSAATKTLHVKASMGSASWNNGSFTVTPDQP